MDLLVDVIGRACQTDSISKRRPAEFVVPDFVTEDEMAEYLRDLFHESASPQHPDVVRLP